MNNIYLSREAEALSPYTPGEQPKENNFIKLNTNESPFPPSPKVMDIISREEVGKLYLYPDPECGILIQAVADYYNNFNIKPENIIPGNGSDEILAFAFRAFCGRGKPVAYADITYGFYQAQSALFGLDAKIIKLKDNFVLDIDDYLDFPGTVFIANPNAPTGMAIEVDQIERLLKSNPERVVVIDEAYVDFGAESCVRLIEKYQNLLVVQTFSKSRSLAGGRVGFGMGSQILIENLNRVKYSWNPYNINRLSILAAAAAISDIDYFKRCTSEIIAVREEITRDLKSIGFTVLTSRANFIFAAHESISGWDLYRGLKSRGILVRWFDAPRLDRFVRITIGSREQMAKLLETVREMME